MSRLSSLGRAATRPTSHDMLAFFVLFFSCVSRNLSWSPTRASNALKSAAHCSSKLAVASISGAPHSISHRKYTSSTARTTFPRSKLHTRSREARAEGGDELVFVFVFVFASGGSADEASARRLVGRRTPAEMSTASSAASSSRTPASFAASMSSLRLVGVRVCFGGGSVAASEVPPFAMRDLGRRAFGGGNDSAPGVGARATRTRLRSPRAREASRARR